MPKNKLSFLSPFVFIFNTYLLMIVGGGQMAIAIAYAIAPLVLGIFIKLIEEEHFDLKKSILTGLIIALQLIFDPRAFYATIVSVLIYFIVVQLANRNSIDLIKKFIVIFVPPGVIAFLVHAFWLIPLLVTKQNPIQQLGPAYSSVEIVPYLSFAKFEQTISMLHPYWPENIFGKVYFMKSEFLLIPILAYLSLFFVKKLAQDEKKYIIFFIFLGLIGSFLAKGANDPFGGIYLWLFEHIPGFVMFRDPTKWYFLVVLSYSILIPFSIWKLYKLLESQLKFQISNFKFQITTKGKILNVKNFFLLFITLYLLYLIRPAFFGELTGTFRQQSLPQEYVKLANFLSKEKVFYRTFWIPTHERFGFRSDIHPSISGQEFINKYNPYDVVKYLNDKKSQVELQNLSVKYVIVPFDSQHEIFLKDRKYFDSLYLKTIEDVRKINWLKEVKGFGKITVFEILDPRGHFWSPSENLEISFQSINPTKYKLSVKNAQKNDVLVFSESFDKYWVARNNEISIKSHKYSNLFNSFTLPKGGDYTLEIYYTPQDWVNRGVVISLISVSLVLGLLIFGYISKKW